MTWNYFFWSHNRDSGYQWQNLFQCVLQNSFLLLKFQYCFRSPYGWIFFLIKRNFLSNWWNIFFTVFHNFDIRRGGEKEEDNFRRPLCKFCYVWSSLTWSKNTWKINRLCPNSLAPYQRIVTLLRIEMLAGSSLY